MSSNKLYGPVFVPKKRLLSAGTNEAWWYYDNGGIDLLATHTGGGGTVYFRIPWSDLRRAMKRAKGDW